VDDKSEPLYLMFRQDRATGQALLQLPGSHKLNE
jgi:hypothetical protein